MVCVCVCLHAHVRVCAHACVCRSEGTYMEVRGQPGTLVLTFCLLLFTTGSAMLAGPISVQLRLQMLNKCLALCAI